MSNLFGGSSARTAATTPTQAMGIDFTSAQYGPPLTVIYGTNKTAGTCIWYGDFKSTAQKTKTGGKGGGSTTTGYTYSASFQLALCEGPIQGIGTVWNGTSTVSLSSVGAVTALGTQGQAPWSHLSGAASLGYTETALASVQNLSLGSSASLPDWNFEVQGLCIYGSGIVDAEPSAILNDICTNSQHGISFPWVGDLTQYRDYCVATGLFISPIYDQEESAESTLEDLLKYTNSAGWFSEGVLKIAPYGDTTVTGNGVTYTPNVSPLFDLGTSDFIIDTPGDAPVQVTRKSPATAMNMVRVQYTDRANTYHDSVEVGTIDEDIITNGQRADDTEDCEMAMAASVARFIAQNLVQRAFFIRNTYEFKLSWRYCMLEPMDIVTLTDPVTGLNLTPVRITEVAEDENGTLSITAEEFPEGVGHSAIYNTQPNSGSTIDPNADPGGVNAPYLFRMPGFLASNNTPEIGVAVNGSNALWGAADIYLSHDGSSYYYVGTTAQSATYGDLGTALPVASADPDTTNTPTVQLYAPGELLGGSQADADNFVTLAMVDSEVVSYESATLTGSETYQLSYLRRGAYGTGNVGHAAGAPFVRLDDAIYRMPIDPSLIGTTIYLKFVSINCFGRTPRTLAEETAYTYVVGTNAELPDVPPPPASFATQGVADGVSITWNNTNPAAVGCTTIERSTASGGPWAVIAQVGPTTTGYTDHFTDGSTYYYRARARGPLISSGWSSYSDVFNSTGTDVSAIVTNVTSVQAQVNDLQIINLSMSQGMLGWTSAPTSESANWYGETGTNGPNGGTSTYIVHKVSGVTSTLDNTLMPCYPRQVIKAQGQCRGVDSPNGAAAMFIAFYDINKSLIGAPTTSSQVSGNGQYQLVVTAIAPSNAAFVTLGPSGGYATSTPAGYYTFANFSWNYQPSTADELPESSTRKWAAESGATVGATWGSNIQEQPQAIGANLCQHGDFSDSSLGTWFANDGNALALNYPSGMQFTAGAVTTARDTYEGTNYFTVSGAQAIFMSAWMSAGSSALQLGLECIDTGGSAHWVAACTLAAGQGWQAVSGLATVPANCIKARAWVGQNITAASNASTGYFAQVDIQRTALATPGSGLQIGDQRNLPAITFSNYGSGWNGMSLSYTSTTTSATITASAATLQAGSVAIGYNAASVTVSGSAGSTTTYYLYYTDPNHAGGSLTLNASTNILNALNNNGNVYIAAVSVSFPTSGSGGGSGGGPCALRTAWVIRRGRLGRPQHVRAAKVRVGDWLLRSDGQWAQVTYSQPRKTDCVRLVADGFGTLGCSVSAPLETAEGSVRAAECLQHEVVLRMHAVRRYAAITRVIAMGEQWVQHITLGNAPTDFFWVGDAKECLFAHHNMKPINT